MPKPGLLTRQLICLGLYTLFFAVQLHYKYVYIYAAFNHSKSQVAAADDVPGAKFCKGTPGSQHKFNLKLNKRFFPSDFVAVHPVTVRGDFYLPAEPRKVRYTSHALITQTGLVMADRGPPAQNNHI